MRFDKRVRGGIVAVALTVAILPFLTYLAQAADTTTPKAANVDKKSKLTWHEDYYTAVKRATADKKQLLILFVDGEEADNPSSLEPCSLTDPEIVEMLGKFTLARLPIGFEIDGKEKEDGSFEQVRLIDDPSFAEIQGRVGVAILDFENEAAPYYRFVVSTFPILKNSPYSKKQFRLMLELPPGSLTQRTLVWAVRNHPECPKSTNGFVSRFLFGQARSHADYQARIRVQGHQNWESRFHRIVARLPGGLSSSEVCAESWPGEGLVVAAIECVRCWKFSSGHWSKVRKFHPLYGYDMKRGKNGIWYATGVFGEGNLQADRAKAFAKAEEATQNSQTTTTEKR
jgi:hypothetical protein